jgi:acyl-CoA oxidase
MGTSGFVHLDFLNCCKFAEGDSRILMQKMARDRLRRFAKEPPSDGGGDEARLCASLAKAMAAGGSDKAKQAEIWDDEWINVYALAEAIMQRTFDDALR